MYSLSGVLAVKANRKIGHGGHRRVEYTPRYPLYNGYARRNGIEVVDFAGRTYDPGMVPEVVDVREDPEMPRGRLVIDETIAQTVTWRGQVVEPGQIIIKRSPARRQE